MKSLLLPLVLLAAITPAQAAKKPAKTTPMACPVTGEKIAKVNPAAGSSVYKGKTYHFCCIGCKPMFDKEPGKYVKPAAKKDAKKSA